MENVDLTIQVNLGSEQTACQAKYYLMLKFQYRNAHQNKCAIFLMFKIILRCGPFAHACNIFVQNFHVIRNQS